MYSRSSLFKALSNVPLYKKIIWIYFVLSSLFVLYGYTTPLTTNDIWIQIKVGQLIRENLEIPKTILFAFSEAKDYTFVAHEWFPSLIFGIIYDYLGYKGLVVFKGLGYLCVFYLLVLFGLRQTQNKTLSLSISLLSVFFLNYRSFLRPELFAYLFFVLQIHLLDLYLNKKNIKWLLFYSLVHIFWTNSHGSFLVSLGLPFVFILGSHLSHFSQISSEKPLKIKKFFHFHKNAYILGLFSFILAALSLINPQGYKLFIHAWNLSHDQYIQSSIFEWRPMFSSQVQNTRIYPLFIIYLILFTPLLLVNFKRWNLSLLFVYLIFLYLTFTAQRHFAFLSLISGLFLLQSFKWKKLDLNINQIYLAQFSLVLILLGINYTSKNGNMVRAKPGFDYAGRIPEETLDFIRTHKISGNVFNTYVLGGQLIFYFYPQIQITIDSRIDAYGSSYMKFYRELIRGSFSLWRDFLDRNNINHIILDTENQQRMQQEGLISQLKEEDWSLVHKSQKVFIYSRESSKDLSPAAKKRGLSGEGLL